MKRLRSTVPEVSSERTNRSISKIGKHPLRVLHVDDDENQLLFTKIFLEKCDPSLIVKSESNPLKVFETLSEESFDCVVSDYQMEEMDGVLLTRRIRVESDVPIIIYTGRGSEEIEEVARAAGADAYVQKETDPVHYEGLYRQICGVVSKT